MRTKRTSFLARAAMMLLVMMLTMTAQTAWAYNVTYIDENGNQKTESAIVLNGGGATTLDAGLYVVNSNITYTSTVTLAHDVKIVLMDGCTMNIGTSESRLSGKGFNYNSNESLTIYGQTNGTGTLSVYTSGEWNFGIYAGAITINGGHVTADTNGNNAAAIYAEAVTINGGHVTAHTAGSGAYAIFSRNAAFTYNGGIVSATTEDTSSDEYGYNAPAIASYRNYTFNWRNATDRITIGSTGLSFDPNALSSYEKTATFSKPFSDGTTTYSATLTNAELNALANKTLQPAYTITYDLAGGSVATANPTTYTIESAAITLNNPTREGYTFAGWTGTDLGAATTSVTIAHGSTGDRSYTATWTELVSYIDENGDAQSHTAAVIDGSRTNLPGGWYVVNSDVALTTKLNFTGDVYLILADDKTLSIDASNDSGENSCYFGLSCKEGEIGNSPTYYNLTIYGQAAGTGKVTSNNGNHGSAWSYDYFAKNITINGGVVEAKGHQHGIISQQNLTINGGQVSTDTDMSANIVTLGWRNPADYIQANEINCSSGGSITIADDKVFTDGTGLYLDTTPTATLDALQDVTLQPFTCVALTTDNSGNITATFDGSTLNETFSIPCDLEVNDVQFNRTFTKDKKTCICWPFAVSQDKADALGKFYQFTGVTAAGEIEMTQVTTGGLEANKPYIFEPGSDLTDIDFGAKTLKTGGAQATGNGFTFKGIYDRVKWTTDDTDPFYDATYEDELGKAYGFALEALNGYSVGQFVKLGSGAHSRPFRAYLLYDGAWDGNQPSAGARGANSGTSLPDVIDIVWISGNSQTTGIETITTSRETDEWYSLDGRKLSGKPATKGLYIHNCKKKVVK